MRRRLLAWLLPTTLALAAIWLWAAYAIVVHFVNVAYDRSLEDSVETIARQVVRSNGAFSVDLPPAARQMLEFDRVDQILYLMVDGTGTRHAGNADVPAPATVKTNSHGNIFYDVRIEGRDFRIVQTRVSGDGGRFMLVRVAETRQKRNMLSREVMAYMVAPQSLFMMGIIALIWIGVGRGIAPLARVREAIARLDPNDLRQIDDHALPMELHQQVGVMNGLIGRLSELLSAQRRFIADASHQLRTPLTNMRTQLELALRTQNYAEMRTMLEKVDAASNRLVRLTAQLLTLSRIEAGADGFANFTRFSIDTAMADAISWCIPSALKKGIEIRFDASGDDMHFLGDQHAIEQMVANLVDNAVNYTQASGKVLISLRRHAGAIQIVVRDNGPGLSEADRDRVLNRFDRGTRPSGSGSGLGLSIAQEAVRLHHGTIRLRNEDGHGLCVKISLPIESRPDLPH
ncbi:MAG: sensor histidine kinase [Novosphingobium sp.]